MGAGFVVLIHLIFIFILSLIIAFFSCLITSFVANQEKRKRKIFLAFLIPFLLLYTYYFTALIGTSIVGESKNVDIGIGDTWFAPLNETSQILFIDLPEQAYIESEGESLISEVATMHQEKEKVYGKTYHGDYFAVNLSNNDVKKYGSKNELLLKENLKRIDLVDAMDFYNKRKTEVSGTLNIIVMVLSILISIGIAFLSSKIVLHGFRWKSEKKTTTNLSLD